MIPADLLAYRAQCASIQPSPATDTLVSGLLDRHGHAVQAVLGYGSCFRTGNYDDGVVDLYVLIDRYSSVHRRRLRCLVSRLLPPDVYCLRLSSQAGSLHVKYAVLTLSDFLYGTSTVWFHSYLWARFAQPAALLYSRTPSVEHQVHTALAQAVVTFLTRTVPRMDTTFLAEDLWHTGFALTYGAELRAERLDRIRALIQTDQSYYEHVTRAAIPAVPFPIATDESEEPARYHAAIPGHTRAVNRFAWVLRRLVGKLLSLLRLIKAAFTFEGGVEYVLWKIHRHSGVAVTLTPRQRRHPLLAGWTLLVQLYRRGAIR